MAENESWETQDTKGYDSADDLLERLSEPHYQLNNETDRFLQDLDVAREVFELLDPILQKQAKEDREEFQKILEGLQTQHNVNKGNRESWVARARTLKKVLSRMTTGTKLFRRQSIASLVSRFDEFLSCVLRIALKNQPERLQGKNKCLPYEDALTADSIDQLLSKIVAKEVGAIMRDSHENQLVYIDDRFKLGLRDNFGKWSDLIEIMQRRNLFVHAGGVVSQKYLAKCREMDITPEPSYEVGDLLSAEPEYYMNAFYAMYELGLRVGQGLFRRLFPEKLDEADQALNDTGFSLLTEERWRLAGIVFDFALEFPSGWYSNDSWHKLFLVNRAIAYKESGKTKEMTDLLNGVDWSALAPRFRLAMLALRGQFDAAEKVMKAVSEDEINKHAYRTWPVFRHFRNTKQFARAYQDLFNEEFQPTVSEEDLQEETEPSTRDVLDESNNGC